MFIQTLIAELAVEALDEGIVGRFPRPCMLNDDLSCLRPLMKDRTGKFRAVIHAYPLRIAMELRNLVDTNPKLCAAIAGGVAYVISKRLKAAFSQLMGDTYQD